MLLQIQEPGESSKEAEIAVGIDLGTTHSLVACKKDGAIQMIENASGSAITPSVVAYHTSGEVTVGAKAKQLQGKENYDVISSVKRALGVNVGDVDVHGEKLSSVQVSAEILKQLKADAENALKQEVGSAVITVPAYFDDTARQATKDAAKLAGLEVLRLINEPTAAALAYGLDNAVEGLYAVYDLGGGTFDLSLLKLEKGVFQVVATGGDIALGGDDVDEAVTQWIVKEYNLTDLAENDVVAIKAAARELKEQLSDKDDAKTIASVNNKELDINLNINNLNELSNVLLDRSLSLTKHVLFDAEIEPEDVKGVILVGGSTRLKAVSEKLGELFGSEKLLTNLDPDKVVAMGAAEQAHALTQGSETLLLDVTPLSLGLETMGGLVERIIERNSPIPTSKAQSFTTFKDGQTAMGIHVVQGEREMVDQCRSLAKFNLTDIPPMAAGIAKITVTFALDADGLLEVSAEEETTGKKQTVEVKPSYGLDEAEMERMLRESLEFAREDISTRLLVEARVEAERLIYDIETAMEKDADLLTAEEAAAIQQSIVKVKAFCEESNRDDIDLAVQELDKEVASFADRRVNSALGKMLSGKSVSDVDQALQAAES